MDDGLLQTVEHGDEEPRFVMLETVREYAREQLTAHGELNEAQEVHAAFYRQLAEQAAVRLSGPDQDDWLARLDAEHDNLRAALAWSRDRSAGAAHLPLATTLWRFWQVRGYLSEGRRWLEEALAHGSAPPSLRAEALTGAAALARSQGDYEQAVRLQEESLKLWQEIGDQRGTATALQTLGVIAWDQGGYQRAIELYEEGLAISRDLGDRRLIGSMLGNLGSALADQGDSARAVEILEESLALRREMNDRRGIAILLSHLGRAAKFLGEAECATAYYTEALLGFRRLGDIHSSAVMLVNLGQVAIERGALHEATGLYDEALALCRDLGEQRGIAECLTGFGQIAAARGRPARAARLLGSAAALRRQIGASQVPPPEQARYDSLVAGIRAAVGEETFAAAWTTGVALPLDRVLAGTPNGEESADERGRDVQRADTPAPPRTAPALPGGLTAREAEVLGLIAAGGSNREIADTLVVSVRTVEHHIANIYRKIDARGRADATAYAIRHGLLHPEPPSR